MPASSTLTIYAQSDGERAGKIVSRPSGGSGIGGKDNESGGTVTINGGVVNAAHVLRYGRDQYLYRDGFRTELCVYIRKER